MQFFALPARSSPTPLVGIRTALDGIRTALDGIRTALDGIRTALAAKKMGALILSESDAPRALCWRDIVRQHRALLTILVACLFFGPAANAADPAPVPVDRAAQAPRPRDSEAALIERGRYLAHLGDCVACHTANEGPAMAGGLELKTPMGTIHSTNITPDAASGIGNYSFTQFDRAMRKGVAADGHNLYPAMPYPSYAKMSEDDMRALYAFLMQGLAPISQANKPAQMRWPFSMRWGLSFWNWAFLQDAPFKPDASKDAVWNRGAYLVQGLGHCGSCHTPRGIAFQEKAMSEAGADGKHYLAGETVESWRAFSLRNLWTVQDTALLLKTGQNRFATVSGNMAQVIHNSTQHFTDADLTAIATYLKSLPPGEDDLPMPAAPVRATAAPVPANLFTTRGGLGYVQFCVDCHRQDGAGVKGIFPAMQRNPSITIADPSTLLHISLTGWKTAETAAHPRIYTMPAFARLSDQELAEILSFVRSSWGNNATSVAPSQVKKMRAKLDPKTTDSSHFETPRLADMLASPNAGQISTLAHRMVPIEDFRARLTNGGLDELINDVLLADGALHVSDQNIRYIQSQLASKFRVEEICIDVYITGSAKLGYSLVEKVIKGARLPRYRAFSAQSDIDVAVVSEALFKLIWMVVRSSTMSKVSKRPSVAMPTVAQDRAITASAKADPDAQPLTPKQLKEMVPIRALRGRPKSANPKQLVSVRYSPEVLEYFKSTGEGWQSRMDGVLREYVTRHQRRA